MGKKDVPREATEMLLISPAMAAARSSSEPPQPHSPAHVPALDGVRGVAILFVLLYHLSNSLMILGVKSPALNVFRFGWFGVDVFFALSGFLITGILLDTKSSPDYFKSFYVRRVLRIFPLYFGAILVVLLLRNILPEAGIWGEHKTIFAPASLLWPVTILENAAILPQGFSVTGVLTHYWSLSVEEHFYLLWPLLIWLATKRQALALAFFAAGISIAGRTGVWFLGYGIDHVFGLTPLRMDGLAIGAIATILVRGNGIAALTRWAPVALAVIMATLAALFLARHTLEQWDPVIWVLGYPLVAAGAAATLVASMTGGRLGRLMSAGPLRWFGKYSFGLYVWHPIIIVLLFHSRFAVVPSGASPALLLGLGAFIFALCLLAAWLSYHLWEKRFLDLKRYFPARSARPRPAAAADDLELAWVSINPPPGQ